MIFRTEINQHTNFRRGRGRGRDGQLEREREPERKTLITVASCSAD